MFYNLRKPVLRSLRGACHREDVIFCRSELEVYAHIDACYSADSRPFLMDSAAVRRGSRGWISQSYGEC